MKLQQAVAAIALRESGMKYADISDRLDVPVSTVWNWVTKGAPEVPTACAACGGPLPERAAAARFPKWCSDKCRKTLYAGTCIDCGCRTDGSNGRGPNASKRCVSCRLRFQHDNARWTQEAIVTAIREWVDEYGRPPTAGEWRVQQGRDIPPSSTVQRAFGKWSDAIVAAGFSRPVAHRPSRIAA